MFDIGCDYDWFSDWCIVVLVICVVVGGVVFVIWEWIEEYLIVDFRIFCYCGFGFVVLMLVLCFVVYFVSIIIIL